jgi:hypothetical protein
MERKDVTREGEPGQYVVLAVKVPAGRRWARIVATILLAFNVVVGVASLFAISDETPLNPVGIALAVVGLVLLWAPSRKHAATR